MTQTASSATSGTVGHLTPDEAKKLQQAWVHILRLSGCTDVLQSTGSSEAWQAAVPDMEHELNEHHHHHHHHHHHNNHNNNNTTSSLLTPEEFRTTFWEFVSAEHPDALVLRFLRARKWDVARGTAMLASAVHWRQQRCISGTIIRDGEAAGLKPLSEQSEDERGFLAQYRSGKSYVRSADREGRLVYVIRVRHHDPRAQTADCMERYVLHNIESLRVLLRPPTHRCCLIFDLTGFGIKNMDFHVVKFLVTVFEARYPETLGAVLIHNAPFVFWGIWKVIQGWLDPVIAAKIHFTRKPADLLRFIPAENLQASYGGQDKWEYEYIEPVAGENDKLEDKEGREVIEKRRAELLGEFERETAAWAAAGLLQQQGVEEGKRRSELADQITTSYWTLDPYIRSVTYFHRQGLFKEYHRDVAV